VNTPRKVSSRRTAAEGSARRSLRVGGLVAVFSATLGWGGSSAAQTSDAPATPGASPPASAGPTPGGPPPPAGAAEAQQNAVSPSGPRPLRVGVLGGIGFPRPLAIEALAVFSGLVAVGVEYGALPAITVDGVNAGLWSVAADLRVFPFQGAFYLGLRAGRQHARATTSIAAGSFGDATEILDLDSWFLNPRAGFLWTTRDGLSFGVEAGVQFPLSPGVSSSLPLSLYPSAQHTIDALGSSVIPTVDLLRIGLLL
jgi:hypothetical protein